VVGGINDAYVVDERRELEKTLHEVEVGLEPPAGVLGVREVVAAPELVGIGATGPASAGAPERGGNLVYTFWEVLTVFVGRLHAGGSTCHGRAGERPPDGVGRVYAMRAGQRVSYDRDIGHGWTHIAAVRDSDALKLHANGRLRSGSAAFAAEDYSVTSGLPMRIGFGAGGTSAERWMTFASTQERSPPGMCASWLDGKPPVRGELGLGIAPAPVLLPTSRLGHAPCYV